MSRRVTELGLKGNEPLLIRVNLLSYFFPELPTSQMDARKTISNTQSRATWQRWSPTNSPFPRNMDRCSVYEMKGYWTVSGTRHCHLSFHCHTADLAITSCDRCGWKKSISTPQQIMSDPLLTRRRIQNSRSLWLGLA